MRRHTRLCPRKGRFLFYQQLRPSRGQRTRAEIICSISPRANRPVAAIAQVVGDGVVGGRAVVRHHVGPVVSGVAAHAHGRSSGVGVAIDVAGTSGAVATGIAAHRAGLRGDGGEQQRGSENESSKCFHGFGVVEFSLGNGGRFSSRRN